jgi:hypothetical protein
MCTQPEGATQAVSKGPYCQSRGGKATRLACLGDANYQERVVFREIPRTLHWVSEAVLC